MTDSASVRNDSDSTSGRRKWLILAVASVAVVVAAVASVVRVSDNGKVRRALDLARLADWPEGATGIRADGRSNMFSTEYRLRFSAPPEAIEAWIRQSPGLKGVAPEQFTPQHMLLPYPADGETSAEHCYFHPDPRYPWFDPTIRNRGRRYEVPQDANACWGEVLIDDETGTVYIQSHRS
ncbi:MAG: hypothetical protein JXB13_21735 [Phycisphaerae bacterium]|nr:hypothetical protein [Phycisphaerae bacterium]